ncbi:MAG: hypothetical protein EHM46_04500 [Bacteroidetes bacterium]|nr:MAG: hypothetical protein EHM46_04500 [Bacteroidota bacterium]
MEQTKAEPVEQTKAKPVDEPVVETEATAGDRQATESNGEPEVKTRATRSKPGKAQAKKDVKPEPASETATGEKDAE